MKNNAVEPIKLITCIVNRGDGETVTELCAREGISCSVVLRGRGTADNRDAHNARSRRKREGHCDAHCRTVAAGRNYGKTYCDSSP